MSISKMSVFSWKSFAVQLLPLLVLAQLAFGAKTFPRQLRRDNNGSSSSKGSTAVEYPTCSSLSSSSSKSSKGGKKSKGKGSSCKEDDQVMVSTRATIDTVVTLESNLACIGPEFDVPCLTVSGPNAVLDCAGYRIDGASWATGIEVTNGGTVQNCNLAGFNTVISMPLGDGTKRFHRVGTEWLNWCTPGWKWLSHD